MQHALREVVGRCIYGVDVNPLAAELAKVSLWLEALEPGKPLGFLDARIRVGNSLLGTTPALIAGEVPDEAFKEIEGDDKKFAAAIRKRNKRERAGQDQLDLFTPLPSNAPLAREREPFLSLTDDPAKVRKQASAWASYETGDDELLRQREQADTWCAAFVWKLAPGEPQPPTAAVVRSLDSDSHALTANVRAQITRLAQQYRFFHWHLEFPEILTVDGDSADIAPEGWSGGFSCLLGNPPWEHTELKEQEFFAARDPEITAAAGAARKQLIKQLPKTDPALWALFSNAKRMADSTSALVRLSGRFPLTGRGRINTYAIFAETFRSLLGDYGRCGVIVPTGIATDATTQYFFRDLVESHSLAALYDFENRAGFFEDVDSRTKFSLLTLVGRRDSEPAAHFAFFLHDPAMIETASFSLTREEILLLNPNTGTCPVFRSRRDAEITLGIYKRVPVLVKEGDPDGNPWGVSFMQGLFNMTSDSDLFHTREELEADGWYLDGNIFIYGKKRMLPLYEAKMIHHYDHRWGTFDGSDIRYVTLEEKQDPSFVVLPRYWVLEAEVSQKLAERSGQPWFSSYRWVTNATNERTLVCSPTPLAGAGNSQAIVLASGRRELLLSTWSSLCCDYIVRQKLGGQNLTFGTMHQIAIPAPGAFESLSPWASSQSLGSWISLRVLELSFTAEDIIPLAKDVGDYGRPFHWNAERRALLRAELDATFFHVYGLSRKDVDYILDTFPIVRRKDEATHGEYRTKRLILEVYDRMAEAIRTGEPYQTILDPAPGQGPRHHAKYRER